MDAHLAHLFTQGAREGHHYRDLALALHRVRAIRFASPGARRCATLPKSWLEVFGFLL